MGGIEGLNSAKFFPVQLGSKLCFESPTELDELYNHFIGGEKKHASAETDGFPKACHGSTMSKDSFKKDDGHSA